MNCMHTPTTFYFYIYIAEPPRIYSHPQELRDAVLGKTVKFTIHATGTDPLRYQWQWKPVEEECWNPCDSEKFPGSDTSTVTIPNVQKTNEGSYRCVITNYAGSQTSKPAKLSIGKHL